MTTCRNCRRGSPIIPKDDNTADREIVLRRVFAASRELVFTAWTDPMQIGKWWGPQGFTTTIHAMDVRPNGYWRYTMHGPDGTDYETWVHYITISRPGLLVYNHGAGTVDMPAHFQSTVTFVETAGKTEVTMCNVFPTAAARDLVVKRYSAIEGGKQTLARLDGHLAMLDPAVIQAFAGFRFVRRFAAPRDLVFTTWTDPSHLQRWWGPHGFTNPRCEFVPHPGGRIHIDMRGQDGVVYPMAGHVAEVRPPEFLSFACTPLDEEGESLFQVINQVHFSEADGLTTVTVEAKLIQVTSQGSHYLGGMETGWNQSLERLGNLIATLTK
jgi:uncharacterized protein YndB with AHSA1/START domain